MKRSSDIVQKLGDFYNTFSAVLNFVEESWRCLVDCSKNIIEYKVTAHSDRARPSASTHRHVL